MKTRSSLAIALLLAAGIARAEESAASTDAVRPGWYAAPMFSYLFPEWKRRTGQGMGGIVAFGHHAKVASVEAAFLYAGNFKRADDAELIGGQLALLIGPMSRNEFLARFFALVGMGGFDERRIPAKSADGSGLFGDLGVGYYHPLELFGVESLFRLDIRYRADYQMPPRQNWESPYFRDWMVNLGLQIPLSPKPPPPPPPEKPEVVPPVTAQPAESTAQPPAESSAPAPAESGASPSQPAPPPP